MSLNLPQKSAKNQPAAQRSAKSHDVAVARWCVGKLDLGHGVPQGPPETMPPFTLRHTAATVEDVEDTGAMSASYVDSARLLRQMSPS